MQDYLPFGRPGTPPLRPTSRGHRLTGPPAKQQIVYGIELFWASGNILLSAMHCKSLLRRLDSSQYHRDGTYLTFLP
jgi:hypothetical protein